MPPVGVNFTELPTRLRRIRWSLASSAYTFSWIRFMVSIKSSSPFACICPWIMLIKSCIMVGRWASCSWICIFPLSMRLISSTSLIMDKRCLLEAVILAMQSCTRSLSLIWAAAMPANPTMAFMGVRMSWDMLLRKADLLAFALLAFS